MAEADFRTWTVYGLLESGEVNRIRYVGQTSTTVRVRLKNHLVDAKRNRSGPVRDWIRDVLARGGAIEVVTLKEGAQVDVDEARFIAAYRDSGILLNAREAGVRGRQGASMKEKTSVLSKKRWTDDSYRRIMSASALSCWATESGRKKFQETIRAAKSDPLIRAKTSGEKNGSAKLKPAQVLEMRELAAGGLSTTELGRRFGVSQASAWKIVTRKSWAHV